MRKVRAIGLAVYLVIALSGCGRNDDAGNVSDAPAAGVHPSASASPSLRPGATAESSAWVMSADSFGPITTDMTKKQILATGAFQEPPYACSDRLDWHSQTYWEEDSEGYPGRTEPLLSTVTFQDGKPYYIDAGPTVRTDKGIGVGDTVKDLYAAYPRVFRDVPITSTGERDYGVSGRRSHLVFYTVKGQIEHFYLTPGAIREDERFGADMRGIAPCP